MPGHTRFSAVVTALAVTPVKGLAITSVPCVRLAGPGAEGNRVFFLVDADGKLLNGKRHGPLSTVRAEYDRAQERLDLRFPGGESASADVASGPPITAKFFSSEHAGQVVGDSLGAALSNFAGRSLRLVRADPELSAIDRGPRGGVSLIGRGSVTRLEQVASAAVDPRRFRMLVEVDGPPAHAEDGLVDDDVRIGDALVRFRGHVGRCLVTKQNPDTGLPDLPTLDLLDYRRGLDTTEPLAFGIYGEVVASGDVRVGDAVVAAS